MGLAVNGVEVVGRIDELELLRGFARTEPIDTRALVLEGEAGIGKSTLWQAAVEMVRDDTVRVLVSRPTEPEHGLAFAGLADLLEPVADDVLPLLTPPRRRAVEAALLFGDAEDDVDPRALGVAFRDCIDGLSAGTDVVVAIDDVQWLDDGTAGAMAFALRRLQAPIRLLVARRSGVASVGSDLARVLPDAAVVQVPVGILSLGAMQTMLGARLNRTFTRPVLSRIHATSGGNPFYALEIARALDGPLDPAKALRLPDSLVELTARRLTGLPRSTQAVLGFVAAEGDFPLDLLRTVGISDDDLVPAVEAHVLDIDGSSLAFSHPLLASAAYAQLLPEERRGVHRILAGVVADPVRRARHLALCAKEPDPDIAAMLDVAAGQAQTRGAIGAAAELYDHALRLTPDDADADRHRRTIELARSQHSNGNQTAAEAMARDVVARSRPGVRRVEAVLLLHDVAGDLTDLSATLHSALPDATGDDFLTARIHTLLAWELTVNGRYDSADSHASAAMKLVQQLEDPLLFAETLWTLASQRTHAGKSDAADIVDRAFDVSARLDDPTVVARLSRSISPGATVWTGDHERLRQLLEPVCAEMADSDELLLDSALGRMTLVEFAAGRLRAAEGLARRSRDIQTAYGVDGPGGRFPLALITAFRGLHDETLRLIEEERRDVGGMPWLEAQLESISGRLALWNGEPERACEHFDAAEHIPSLEPGIRRWRAEYVEALLSLGRLDDATDVIDAWDDSATRLGRTVVLAEVRRCRGLVAAADGRVGDAEALLDQAVTESSAVDDPIGRARALLALGRVHRRARKKRASRDAIEAAVDLFDECGADWLAETARLELTTLSGRRRQEGLTSSERRVADLAADGCTNREIAAELFLSVSTVETHLSHVYAKLGVRSRTEMALTLEPHP